MSSPAINTARLYWRHLSHKSFLDLDRQVHLTTFNLIGCSDFNFSCYITSPISTLQGAGRCGHHDGWDRIHDVEGAEDRFTYLTAEKEVSLDWMAERRHSLTPEAGGAVAAFDRRFCVMKPMKMILFT